MDIAPKIESILPFILLVFPGLVSMHIYRILMPAREVTWKDSTIESIFYSTINFALFLPFLILLHQDNFPSSHPYWYAAGLMVIILVGPVVWPYVWSRLIRNKKLMKKLHLPYPTAWDYFFDKREIAFVLIHLKNGKKIGGYYGANSYATSFPRDGDIYLEASIKVKDNGEFEEVIENTKGLLIRKEEYQMIEFFSPSTTQ